MDKNKGVNRTFAKGGDMHMFQQQAAATRRPGKTGKDDARGALSWSLSATSASTDRANFQRESAVSLPITWL